MIVWTTHRHLPDIVGESGILDGGPRIVQRDHVATGDVVEDRTGIQAAALEHHADLTPDSNDVQIG